MLKLLTVLTDMFIAVFGITPPGREQRRKADLLIGGFLLALILVVFTTVGVMVYLISRH